MLPAIILDRGHTLEKRQEDIFQSFGAQIVTSTDSKRLIALILAIKTQSLIPSSEVVKFAARIITD